MSMVMDKLMADVEAQIQKIHWPIRDPGRRDDACQITRIEAFKRLAQTNDPMPERSLIFRAVEYGRRQALRELGRRWWKDLNGAGDEDRVEDFEMLTQTDGGVPVFELIESVRQAAPPELANIFEALAVEGQTPISTRSRMGLTESTYYRRVGSLCEVLADLLGIESLRKGGQ